MTKKVTCFTMAGPEGCDAVVIAETPEEMMDKGWKHMKEAHPELAAKIEANPKEVNDKWFADFKIKFLTLDDAGDMPKAA